MGVLRLFVAPHCVALLPFIPTVHITSCALHEARAAISGNFTLPETRWSQFNGEQTSDS